jgi:uncharacterized protein
MSASNAKEHVPPPADATAPVVIDGHCHVASTRFIPEAFLEDVASNMHTKLCSQRSPVPLKTLVDILIRHHQDHEADALVRDMDLAGIRSSVLLVPDFSHVMPCPLTLEEMAERHHAIQTRHPGRFYVLIGADPRNVHGAAMFRGFLETYHFDGLKLYPPCGYSPSDPRLFPYYEICRERGLPVLLHTGPSAQRLNYRMALPGLIEGAARMFPSVRFILAHGGVTHVQTCAELCARLPNVYLDIAGFSGAINPQGWAHQLKCLFRMGLNHKVIFGTDYPIFRLSGGLSSLLREFFKSDGVFDSIAMSDQQRVMAGNMATLLERRLPRLSGAA